MKYGYFDDKNREYVINTPRTPLPWINYLGTNGFFSLISNTAGGYCFYKDAKHRRILRYRYNNVPADNGGRYFYINDNGDCWTPSYMPMKKELDRYECRHGMGYTVISGERNGIKADETFFVPVNDNCEIHRIKLTNTSDADKNIKLFSFVEFCLWNAQDDMLNYQRNLNTVRYNNPWIMIAETAMGRGERAFEVYKKITPAYIEDISDIHRAEPYVYSQMIAGKDAVRAGEAKNSWLTGTVAWNYYTVSQYILGIRPEFDGLRIEPCLSADIKECNITRKYRGRFTI